jgi:hypothetical protein
MPSEKKYSIWPALFIICVAFGLPITIGTIEVRVARNAHAETVAIQQLQAIAKAENDYRHAHNRFSTNLAELSGLPQAENSYQYDYRQLSPDAYTAVAGPTQPGKHGKRYFYMDQTGAVHYELLRPAGPASPEVPTLEKK